MSAFPVQPAGRSSGTQKAGKKRAPIGGRRRLLAGITLLLSASALTGLGLEIRSYFTRPDELARTGRTLPPLPVLDPLGSVVDAAQVAQGRKRVIVFYSPSCRVCQRELPELRPFPPTLNLVMISERPEREAAITGREASFYDRDGVLSRSFPLAGLPTILLVDRKGVLRAAFTGAQTRKRIQRNLKNFARETQ